MPGEWFIERSPQRSVISLEVQRAPVPGCSPPSWAAGGGGSPLPGEEELLGGFLDNGLTLLPSSAPALSRCIASSEAGHVQEWLSC